MMHSDELCKIAHDVIQAWLAGEDGKAAGDGYRLLRTGERILATDEYKDGDKWVVYGPLATCNGRPIPYHRYRESLARRRVEA
jgi:hypothetical protein